jgi:hypothetical protein
MSQRYQHDNTGYVFRSVIDRRDGQVRCFSSHKSSQTWIDLDLMDFLLGLPTSASNVTSSRFRSWISVVGSVSVEVCLWVRAAAGLHITVPDSPTFTPTHPNIKTATALNVFMLRRKKLSVSARLFFPRRVPMLQKWIFWEFTYVPVKSCLLGYSVFLLK